MYPALILAGGASVRMGRNKATMLVDGAPMITHVAHALRNAGCTTIIVASRDGFQRQEIRGVLSHMTDIEYTLDSDLERSAKSGLKSALRVCVERGIERIQLAPCDTPWIQGQVFRRLQNGSKPVMMPKGKRLQPLLSLIDVTPVLSALERVPVRTSLTDTLRSVPNEVVAFAEVSCFRNVNTPTDLD